MCGRFTLFVVGVDLAEVMGLDALPALKPRYNIAPGQPVLAVRAGGPAAGGSGSAREAVFLHWGLIPSWAKDRKIAYKLINARGETAHEKPSFRAAFKQRRCLLPASGFFEWQGKGKHKQPYFLRLRGGGAFALAGLWERWLGDGEPVESCTILTTTPNALVAPIHDRMPVILPPEVHDTWLTAGPERGDELRTLLAPYPAAEMEAVAVSTLVNQPAVDDPRCIEPATLF